MAVKITKGAGNVFRDLGFAPAEAEHLRVRAELMWQIGKLIRRRKLTQGQAAKLFGVTQPRVNDVVRGRLHRFSIDALVSMLAHAGVGVHLSVGRTSHVA
jgi:predicted XRE-type DNA-binding protein